MIHLRVFWGNHDAESSIYVSDRIFRAILKGKALSRRSIGHYEGQSFTVWWTVENRTVEVMGDHGMDCWKGDLADVIAFGEDGKKLDMKALTLDASGPGPTATSPPDSPA